MLHLTSKMNWKSKKDTYDYLVRKFIDDSRLLLVLWSVRIIHMSYLAAIIILFFFIEFHFPLQNAYYIVVWL
jgi:hypothetical protein